MYESVVLISKLPDTSTSSGELRYRIVERLISAQADPLIIVDLIVSDPSHAARGTVILCIYMFEYT